MFKTSSVPVLTSAEVLSHRKSRVTVHCGELSVTELFNAADFEYGKHFRTDHYSVILCTCGSAEISLDLIPYTLKKGMLLILAPNVIRQMLGASQDTRTMIIHFTMHFLNQAGLTTRAHDFLSYFSSQFKPVWDLDPADANIIERNMRDLFERCKQADRLFGVELVNHVFLTLLYEIAAQRQKYSPPLIRQVARKEELVIRFSNLVANNFREQRTVQFYANALNVTPKYLTKIVKEINGKTAGEIIDHYIILESKVLLEKPEHTISHIASLLNFSNQSFFGKYFKRITGISPKKFQNKRLRITCETNRRIQN